MPDSRRAAKGSTVAEGMTKNQYAMIAGSVLQSFGGDSEGRQMTAANGSPWGPVRQLEYGSETVFVLGRHCDDLCIPPHRINYCANLMVLKLLGVDCVIAVNTVGMIKARRFPGLWPCRPADRLYLWTGSQYL